jgi:hypothetical protein
VQKRTQFAFTCFVTRKAMVLVLFEGMKQAFNFID